MPDPIDLRPASPPAASGTRTFSWVLVTAIVLRKLVLPAFFAATGMDPTASDAQFISDYGPATVAASLLGYLSGLGTRLRNVVHASADKSAFFRAIALVLP